jgi:hypothetical protein
VEEGDRLRVRILSAFEDGRCIEERASFRQRPQLIQDDWSWREDRMGTLQREFRVDFGAGVATAAAMQAGNMRMWSERVRVQTGRAFAGFGFALAIKGLRQRLMQGERVELQAVGFAPRPRAVSVDVSFAGLDELQTPGRTIAGDRFIVHPKIPWIAGLFIDVPDSRIWLTRASPFDFLRWEGFLAQPDDPLVRVDAGPDAGGATGGGGIESVDRLGSCGQPTRVSRRAQLDRMGA